MSVITNKGRAAAESAAKKNVLIDYKKIFIRLKDGDSVRVRLLSAEDSVEYFAHGDYNLGIFTQPCLKPAGKPCAMCEAAKAGIEGFSVLKAKKRYLFAFYDIDEQMVRLFDATKTQANGLFDLINEYKDDVKEVAFTFKRNGEKQATYSLNPILKLKADDKEKFNSADGTNVEIALYEQALQARTYEQQIEELKKAGFPVTEVFNVEPENDVPFDIDGDMTLPKF